jgi:hypothetical protein
MNIQGSADIKNIVFLMAEYFDISEYYEKHNRGAAHFGSGIESD